MGAFGRPSFSEHPLRDIRRAAQHGDPLRLARVEKANTFEIHDIHLLQIQSDSWSATLDLGLHLIQVLRPKRPAQPNPRFSLIRRPFDLQRHKIFWLRNARTLTNATTGPFSSH